MSVLVVVPTLNEVDHVRETVLSLLRDNGDLDVRLAVADGGSTDGTQEIVQDLAAADPRVVLLHNPGKLQSAAMNLACSELGEDVDVVVRADCHCRFAPGWVQGLVTSLRSRREEGCVSVVVPMRTIGVTALQRATAAAQNSFIGNGGSLHRRSDVESQYVDHGHHAAFDRAALMAVGGYNESMATNEDAELDERLREAGGRIFLDASLIVDYFPRDTITSLYQQYLAYGRGRYTTWSLHGTPLKPRQLAPLGVTAMLLGTAITAPRWPRLSVPAAAYAAACLGLGATRAARDRDGALILMGPVAMTSHVAWGLGFIQQACRRVSLPTARRTPRGVGGESAVVDLRDHQPVVV